MNRHTEFAQIIAKLKARGAEKVSLRVWTVSEEEFNLVYKELNLLRSVEKQGLALSVIKDQKQARTQLNQMDEASVDAAIEELMTSIESSNADPAFDISPSQEPATFTDGPMQMDAGKIVSSLSEFADEMKRDFPCVGFDATLTFMKTKDIQMNSNGVDYEVNKGYYSFNTMFTAKIGSKMSSFNYTGFALKDLDTPLMEMNETRELIRQITQQTETKPIPGNFKGEVILAPFVHGSLLVSLISQHFGDSGLITSSSRFPDHLEQKILDEKLTVWNHPRDERLACKEFVTFDNFLTADAPLIEKGVLKHYPIAIFTSNKTGKARTIGPVENLVVEGGDTALAEMISGVKEGVLCMRASFGSPNANGDLSAVLKNSYYIKDGKIRFPISETMMSVNLIDVFNRIKSLSREVYNDGTNILPYVCVMDADFSCK